MVRLAKELGIIKIAEFYIDAARIKANANRSRVMTAAKASKLLEIVDQQIEAYLEGTESAVQADDLLDDLAEREVSPDLRPKLGASDLVQNACFDIHQRFREFRGETAAEWRVWLKRLLVHDVLDARRRFLDAEKRDLRRERRLIDGDESPCDVLDAEVSPRASMIAEEESAALRTALARLSPEYHTVLRLRNWECLPFAEVGRRMSRSEDAARKLWSRAVVRLRAELDGGPAGGREEL